MINFTAYLFVLFQLLDLLISTIAIRVGFTEMNPFEWDKLVICKLVVILCVSLILKLKRKTKLDFIIPAISGLPVLWNILVVSLEL